MSHFEIVLLALALSVDACVVSFSYGLTFNCNRVKNSLLLALFTGIFQGIMPCLGYFLTTYVKNYLAAYAQIIVFVIFTVLGIKFIQESFNKKGYTPRCISIPCLFLIGFATSIDAFSAGISLSLYGNRILKSALLITCITFVNSMFGFWIGGKLKNIPSQILEIFAGIILIFLGIKAIL